MRARVALGLFALLGSLAACTAGDEHSTETGGPKLAATLTARPTVTAERITWSYTLRNDEAVPIAVFNGAWGDDAPDSGPVSWVVAGPDDTIEVSQRLFAPPPDVGLARDYTQYGTVLPPGATLTGTAMASRPFRVNHPYKSAFDPPLELPKDASKVVLCVGIARAADVPNEPTADGSGGPAADGQSQPAADGSGEPTADGPGEPASTPSPTSTKPPGSAHYRHSQGTVDHEHLVCAPPLDLGS